MYHPDMLHVEGWLNNEKNTNRYAFKLVFKNLEKPSHTLTNHGAYNHNPPGDFK